MASVTGISRQKSCKRRGLLSMHFRKFKAPSDALIFGRAYHSCIENTDLTTGILELQKNGLADKVELLTVMYTRFQKGLIDNGINIYEHEIKFEMDIDGLEEKFEGYIDGVCQYQGEVWLCEFKTARSIDVSSVLIDSQITAYLYACRELGLYNPAGVLYIVNQKGLDKPPVVLKNGNLSTAKNQGCCYDDYLEKALEIYGDSIPPKVEDFMCWLSQNDKPKFVVVQATRTKEELDNFGRMLYDNIVEVDDLKKLYKEKGIARALYETPCFPTKYCFDSCDYKEVCLSCFKASKADDVDFDEDFYHKSVEEVSGI